jgi:hypothetical protein
MGWPEASSKCAASVFFSFFESVAIVFCLMIVQRGTTSGNTKAKLSLLLPPKAFTRLLISRFFGELMLQKITQQI